MKKLDKFKTYPFDDFLEESQDDIWNSASINYNKPLFDSLKIAGFANEYVVSAKDQYLYMSNGRTILDATCGFGVNFWGHNCNTAKKIEKSYRKKNLVNYVKTHPSASQHALIHNLRAALPSGLDNFYFGATGAESFDAAIKLAIKSKSANKCGFLVARNGYHGKSLNSMPFSSFKKWNEGFSSGDRVIKFFDFGDIQSLTESVEEFRSDNIGINSIVLETIQGGSQAIASQEFFDLVMKVARDYSSYVILDEIKVGLLRTGKMFAFEHYEGLRPDILLIAKPLGMGICPISVMACSAKTFNKAYPKLQDGSFHSSTFSYFGLSAAVASEFLHEAMQKDRQSNIEFLASTLEESLNRIVNKFPNQVESVTGVGLFRGLKLRFHPIINNLLKMLPGYENLRSLFTLASVSFLYERGLLVYFSPTEPEILHIEPNVCFTSDDIKFIEEKLEEMLKDDWIGVFGIVKRLVKK